MYVLQLTKNEVRLILDTLTIVGSDGEGMRREDTSGELRTSNLDFVEEALEVFLQGGGELRMKKETALLLLNIAHTSAMVGNEKVGENLRTKIGEALRGGVVEDVENFLEEMRNGSRSTNESNSESSPDDGAGAPASV